MSPHYLVKTAHLMLLAW